MESLPLFLQLIKKNIIIYSIISSGNFAHVDLKTIEHVVWGDKAIEFKNFELGEHEKFSSVLITFTEIGLCMYFQTEDPKYFTDTKYYFNEDTTVKLNSPYKMDGVLVNHNTKNLGEFKEFDPPVDVSIHKSSVYGYSVNIMIPDKEGIEKLLKRSFEQND